MYPQPMDSTSITNNIGSITNSTLNITNNILKTTNDISNIATSLFESLAIQAKKKKEEVINMSKYERKTYKKEELIEEMLNAHKKELSHIIVHDDEVKQKLIGDILDNGIEVKDTNGKVITRLKCTFNKPTNDEYEAYAQAMGLVSTTQTCCFVNGMSFNVDDMIKIGFSLIQ